MANITQAHGTLTLVGPWTQESLDAFLPVLDCWAFGQFGIMEHGPLSLAQPSTTFWGCGRWSFCGTLEKLDIWTRTDQSGPHHVTMQQYERLIQLMYRDELKIRFEYDDQDDYDIHEVGYLESSRTELFYHVTTSVDNRRRRAAQKRARKGPALSGGELVVPAGTGTVKRDAFRSRTDLVRLTLSPGIKEIGSSAFQDCTNLRCVTFPEGLAKISGSAFAGCTALEELDLPDGVRLMNGSFSGCTALRRVAVPAHVELTIGSSNFPFDGCSALERMDFAPGHPKYCTVDGLVLNKNGRRLVFLPPARAGVCALPDTVTQAEGINGCPALTELVIPKKTTKLGMSFYGCPNLTTFSVDPGNRAYRSVDGVLFSRDGSTLLRCKKGGAYAVPDGVAVIGSYAFNQNTALTAVSLPDSVTTIGSLAFGDCSSLTQVALPEHLTEFNWQTFYGCAALTEIVIPPRVTALPAYLFSGCASLTRVVLPEGLQEIGRGVFQGCSRLLELTIPRSVTAIHDLAFQDCRRITLRSASAYVHRYALERRIPFHLI